MLRKSCSICGRPCFGSRCQAHIDNSHSRRVPRQQRGYDAAYERARARLFKAGGEGGWGAAGPLCELCGLRITRPEDWSANHTLPLAICESQIVKDDNVVIPGSNSTGRNSFHLENVPAALRPGLSGTGEPALGHAHKRCQHRQGGQLARRPTAR